MIRAAGMAAIVLACTALGARLGFELSERAAALRELERLMATLQGEIQYAATPLQEAFRELAKRGDGRFARFFTQIAQALERREGGSVAEIFRECADGFLGGSGLSPADIEQLVRMGARLGYLDGGMQVQTVRLYREELERARAAAEEDCRQRAEIYRRLGFLGGCFLVLLLL